MGFQDALYLLNLHLDSQEAMRFADETMEFISYHAILASSQLAKERGTYSSYHGSKWSRNIFPQDTIDILEKERGVAIEIKRTGTLDWRPVREHVAQYGMRNSNTMAIAPTATISTISNCFPCIEPAYKNLYVKANMSGEFTVINQYLVEDLKKLGMWTAEMIELIKYYDGNIQLIETIPAALRVKYKESFDLDPLWLLQMTAQRGQWVDQSQSHNVFMKGTSGKMLDDIYTKAWRLGLKTTYYLRTLGATQIEKSTLDAKKFGFTQKRTYEAGNSLESVTVTATTTVTETVVVEAGKACSLEDPDCEACQ
jgi:ribonucleoside-diphosphate reductase alpha chain